MIISQTDDVIKEEEISHVTLTYFPIPLYTVLILQMQKYRAHSLDSVQDILGWHLTCAMWLLATILGVS